MYAVRLSEFVSAQNAPTVCGGLHEHNQPLWRDFFGTSEPLQAQCVAAGRTLVAVMNDIRSADVHGQQQQQTKKQLYAQHRTLSRALMDPELQNLRRKGQTNLNRLKEIAKRINGHSSSSDVAVRLNEVSNIFDEVDRAARRLEQLTEHRRERLRELTRQRALEDEINQVSPISVLHYISYLYTMTFFPARI